MPTELLLKIYKKAKISKTNKKVIYPPIRKHYNHYLFG